MSLEDITNKEPTTGLIFFSATPTIRGIGTKKSDLNERNDSVNGSPSCSGAQGQHLDYLSENGPETDLQESRNAALVSIRPFIRGRLSDT